MRAKTKERYAKYDFELLKGWIEKAGGKLDTRCKDGNTLLHDAVQSGNIFKVRYLVEKGIDLNLKNIVSDTALHFAVKFDRFEIAKILIENGADINAKDLNKMTPCHYACVGNCFDILVLLIENGADSESKSRCGKTPFDFAKKNYNDRIVEYFLSLKGI